MNSLPRDPEPRASWYSTSLEFIKAHNAWAERYGKQTIDTSKMTEQSNHRRKLLEEAIEITSRDRNQAYGNPEDNFRNIANLWTAIHTARHGFLPSTQFNAADVALFCIAIKLARLSTNQTHRDSAVDIAGYAACLADIQYAMNQQPTRRKDDNDEVDFNPYEVTK